ncbi:MAG: polyamine aminopropyltransferase [Vallitaleaceae bacterium]|nr:polyamine aminopropyltransferase [Vallitaleaceae bacterium]
MNLTFTEMYAPTVGLTIKVNRFLHTEQSNFQRLDFFETEEFGTCFTLDGIMMVNEKDEFIYHEMIVHVPMAVHPKAKKVLVIGGGDGGTIRELTKYKTIEHIDLVEIDERVVRTCQKYLPITASQLEDPRVHMHFVDGIAFIAQPKEVYDLILVDSTDPIGPGEGLFSQAFYNNCFLALKEDGILINQHESPYYEKDCREMKRAHQKIKQLFPISKVYQFHMPTYPSGHWLFGFASKKLDPVADFIAGQWDQLGLQTKYYNTQLHPAAFALPTYVKELLNEEVLI